MPFCEKCGANLADGTKFCDKCGAPTSAAAPAAPQAPVYGSVPVGYVPVVPVAPKKPLVERLTDAVPAQFKDPKNKTMFWIGFGSIATLALSYIISMFLYIADLSFFVGMGHTYLGELDFFDAADNTNSVWMVILIGINVIPAFLAYFSIRNPKYKLWSVFAAAGLFTITIIALICWGIMDPADWTGESYNKAAWYVLMDCLSEMWYIKLFVPAGVILGYGVDYLVNRAK